nr:MAG TPA: Integrase [Caudoviricetes sp.]
MRNPNGYGGISNLGGNRRNPFRVRITGGWEYDEQNGKHKQIYKTLGYYPTRKAAMLALAEYNKSPYDIDATKITFKEVYEKWSMREFPNMGTSQVNLMKVSFKRFESLHDIKMFDIRTNHLQTVFDENTQISRVYQEKMKSLLRRMYRFCLKNDIVQKDYSEFVQLTAVDNEESIHIPFTAEEIKMLWDNVNMGVPLKYSAKDIRDIFPVDLILILIYTGMRPGEILKIENDNIFLEDRYMVGGIKTGAGKNRVIPIHNDIFPLVEKRTKQGGKYFVKYKSDNPPVLSQFRKFMFDPVMENLNFNHLPHDGRHTFATFADNAEITPVMVKRIMGHKIKDLTQRVYTHKDITDIVEAVNKINFLKK